MAVSFGIAALPRQFPFYQGHFDNLKDCYCRRLKQ
jgi:hypothetical protein